MNELTKDIETSETCSSAERLLTDLSHKMGQGVLFEFEDESLTADMRRKFAQEHAGKIILSSETMYEYRYKAAVLGAGYQLDDELPPHNKMWDEVNYNIAVRDIVEDVKYDLSTGTYAITEKDLRAVLVYDFENLRTWQEISNDLLYEDED